MGHKYVKEEDTFSTSQNGTVPKPTAADVNAGKVLGANGQWVTNSGGGGSSHNYSTSEQVIGTWVDGKPLYEKTYADVTGNYNSVGIYDIDNTKIVRNVKGRLYFQNSAIQVGAYLNSSYYSGWYQDFVNNGVLAVYFSNDYKNANFEVTVQYTKTTD